MKRVDIIPTIKATNLRQYTTFKTRIKPTTNVKTNKNTNKTTKQRRTNNKHFEINRDTVLSMFRVLNNINTKFRQRMNDKQ